MLRGGFSTAFQRNGLSDFQGVLGANVGLTVDATRSLGNNNLGTIPVLFSAVYDPDGYFIELNRLLGAAAGTERR